MWFSLCASIVVRPDCHSTISTERLLFSIVVLGRSHFFSSANRFILASMNELTNINGSFISNIRITKTISFDMLSKPTSKRTYEANGLYVCCICIGVDYIYIYWLWSCKIKPNHTFYCTKCEILQHNHSLQYSPLHTQYAKERDKKYIAGVQYSMCFWRLLFIRYILQ